MRCVLIHGSIVVQSRYMCGQHIEKDVVGRLYSSETHISPYSSGCIPDIACSAGSTYQSSSRSCPSRLERKRGRYCMGDAGRCGTQSKHAAMLRDGRIK